VGASLLAMGACASTHRQQAGSHRMIRHRGYPQPVWIPPA